jgi:phosphate transport system protein
MRHQFHEEMNNLDAKLLQMGVLAQEALGKSLQCVVKKNLDQAMNVIDEDRLLNNLELGVEADSTKLLALQQPMAVDLRMIIAAIRISGDMERMGDLIKKICQKVTKLKDYDYSAVMPDIEKMYQHVNEMLSDMLKALKDRDVD